MSPSPTLPLLLLLLAAIATGAAGNDNPLIVNSDERIIHHHLHRRYQRRLQQQQLATAEPNGKDEPGDGSVVTPALLFRPGNETTCFLTSVTIDGSTNDATSVGRTNAYPGCGNDTSTTSTFLSLDLLQDGPTTPTSTLSAAVASTTTVPAASTAPTSKVRNASGVFGAVVNTIYAGANYSLDLVVQLNLDDVLALKQEGGVLGGNSGNDDDSTNLVAPSLVQPPDVVVGYVRLVFCDALHIGSCDDALKSSDYNSNVNSTHPAPMRTTTSPDYTNVLDNGVGNYSGNYTGIPSPYPLDWNRSEHDDDDGGPDATYLPLGRGKDGMGGVATSGMDESGILSSPWLAVTLRPTDGTGDTPTTTFQARHIYTVSLPTNVTSGAFFVMGHAHFLFDYDVFSTNSSELSSTALNGTGTGTGTGNNSTSSSSQRITRLDMTRTLSDTAAFVTSPPFIQTSSEAIKFYLIVISVLCGAFALMCFASIIYHRSHPVMTLSQGSFLAALVGACFIQIVFAFTYLPTVSIYCTISGPLELIPMHVGGAILVARVWRAYSALGVAALIGRRPGTDSPPASSRRSKRTFELMERWHLGEKYIQALSWLARLPLRCLGKDGRDPMRHTVRKKVTAKETASLAVMLSLPQVILQVFGAAYYQRGLELQLDATESIGRYICQSYGRWVDQAGIGLVGLVYIGAVAAAWIARLLPSVFNEKNQVFHAAFVNCLIAFITLPLLELTNDPTDSPDIQVFLRSLLSIGIAMTNLIVLIMPKLRRVWSGEKVVLTTVLDARFKAASTAGPANYVATKSPDDERINLKEGDPLPYPIEQQVLRLHDVLRTVEDRCCEGRPLARDEWSRLREYTNSLNAQLLRIDITYNHDTDEESPSS